MSRAELGVFCVLVGSVGIGVYQLVTSPWAEPNEAVTAEETVQGPLEAQRQR